MQEATRVKASFRARLGARLVGTMLGAALVLASGTAWGSSREGLVVSGPATASAPSGGVEVVVDAAVTNAATTRGWIEERAARALAALEPPLAAGDLVRIEVRGGPFDYRISLALLRNGAAIPAEDQPGELECACSSDEMLEAVAAAIEDAARKLAEVAERERKAAEEEAQRRREAEEEEARRREDERKRREAELAAGYRPSKLGYAGVGTLLTGTAFTIGGIVMMRQRPQLVNQWQAHERDWTIPGRTLLGIGVTAMTTGLTILIVDAVRCRRDRSRCGPTTTAWMPAHGRWAAQHGGGTK